MDNLSIEKENSWAHSQQQKKYNAEAAQLISIYFILLQQYNVIECRSHLKLRNYSMDNVE